MDSTDMELECDWSCETSKIVRDEDTDAKRKTIDVDSYRREDVPNPSKIRKNVKQSMVWDHFERLKGDPNDPRAKCKSYGVVYACHSKRNGTGTMKHHLENGKKYPYQKKRDQTQMTLAFKPKDKVGDNSSQLVCESFSLEGCREALVEMIIVDELPFKFVDDFVYDTIVEEFEDDATTPFEQGSSKIDIYLLEANVRTKVSTIAYESAFSTEGRVVDSSRYSLAPKTVEALICTQNWLNSEPIDLQIQHELEEASKFEEGFRVVMDYEKEV
ncbi:zinc finger BED domain-containing protein RICESLEEPER 3-like [Cucumis melo var. makuwa]|uniref:Zinc finger BED domain-containing protein RICESLEEPER 3-like n=1 Tax=Cucumis melo var. makuwa TaxID=1194695 RepID=A0A5A7V125_CUCMM|nr:zinc finger BED domain-containing protein RICESLEEPER 3-like [Cucumis melo var. makuwa]TYK09838.1 zinc finger BED domain-containing protein RICESLEEPER 3-like [Cucumis melo var. makuwa]